MPFEHYIQKGPRRLRCGYTTGSCAALAAKAAAQLLLGGQPPLTATLRTPKGILVTADIQQASRDKDCARCAVQKDAGDDMDVTDGILVWAEVALCERPGVCIDGGEGIGRVTRQGLDQPVGAAAINRTPREMIEDEVGQVARAHGYTGGFCVTISAPGGARIAERTFNPRLGIVGGISILGTSGIVEPQSLQALVDTIRVEMRMLAAQGHKRLVLTPGNYGEAFLNSRLASGEIPHVKCSNFIGDALDFALEFGFEELFLVGHAGKLVKLAAGIMNTHSRYADGRAEVLAAHAAAAGCDRETAVRLMEAVTVDDAIAVLDRAGLREAVLESVLGRICYHVGRRAPLRRSEVILFSNTYGLLAATDGARELLASAEKADIP